ncbi:MAG: VOC family protein [Verrucomicrobiota bacterium]
MKKEFIKSGITQDTDPLANMKAEHVMITTNNYRKTMGWYQDNLGFRIKHEWTVPEFPGLELAYLEKNGFIIEVVASQDTPAAKIPEEFAKRFNEPGIGHFAFLVEDVDAVAKALEAKKVSLLVPPTSFPASGRRLIFIEDDNGNVIEFLEELPPGERQPYTGEK